MKKLFLLPFVALMAMLMACSSDDDGGGNQPVFRKTFVGNLLLRGSSIADDALCVLDVDGKTASITLCGVKFAPAMPAMDITIPMLDCVKGKEGYMISGENVVPLAGGALMESFAISSVEASLKGDEFVLSAEMAMGNIGFSTVPATPVAKSKSYGGELKVGSFAMDAVVDVKANREAGTVDIVMNDVKFAPNMPLVIDITLRDISCVADDGISFMAHDVVPYMNAETEPAPAYTFSVIEGNVDGGRLVFNARMADGLAAYLAGKEFVFEGNEIVQ